MARQTGSDRRFPPVQPVAARDFVAFDGRPLVPMPLAAIRFVPRPLRPLVPARFVTPLLGLPSSATTAIGSLAIASPLLAARRPFTGRFLDRRAAFSGCDRRRRHGRLAHRRWRLFLRRHVKPQRTRQFRPIRLRSGRFGLGHRFFPTAVRGGGGGGGVSGTGSAPISDANRFQ